MGARPRWFLAVVLLPPGTGGQEVRELFSALHAALDGMDVALVGGHTEVTDAVARPVVVGQMMGLREDGGFVPTGGLSPGDAVLQVGPAPVEGAAVLAAEAVRSPREIPGDVLRAAARAIEDPGISIVAPALRAAELGALAMHDPTEGGLSAGLHELAEASGVALVVDEAAVQWFEPGRRICRALGLDPWGVLASGALLAGFSPETVEAARRRLDADGYAATRIRPRGGRTRRAAGGRGRAGPPRTGRAVAAVGGVSARPVGPARAPWPRHGPPRFGHARDPARDSARANPHNVRRTGTEVSRS